MLLQAHPLQRRVAVLAQPIASPSRTLSVFASLAKTQRRLLPAALSVEGSAALRVQPACRGVQSARAAGVDLRDQRTMHENSRIDSEGR